MRLLTNEQIDDLEMCGQDYIDLRDAYTALRSPREGEKVNTENMVESIIGLRAANRTLRQDLRLAQEELAALRAPLPCGHPGACWVEGAHTPHDGDMEHRCGHDCEKGYCRWCQDVKQVKIDIGNDLAHLDAARDINMKKPLREFAADMKANAWHDGLCVDPDLDEMADELESILDGRGK